MSKSKKKLEHIQVKDNGIKLSNKIGDKLSLVKNILEQEMINDLISNSNETNLTRYRIAQNNLLKKYEVKSNVLINLAHKEVKKALKNDSSVNLTNKQVKSLSAQIDKGLLLLQNDAILTYSKSISDIVFQCKSASDLKTQLAKHINSGLDIGVVYQDGKHFQFDTYWEMKARTDIQQDIGKNMVDTGSANGVIFYITSYYGDCAKDHADYQGKIYVDKDWESTAPKERIEEIRNYINSNKIMTVQEVMDGPVYLTTRPNCRHYFQYIDIDSVLGAKTEKQLNNLREERDLNFNGKYKPEKYKALQAQRQNERQLRAEKAEIAKQEQLLHLNPGDKQIQQRIVNGEARVREIQEKQRELIRNNSNLERRYDREQPGNRVDLGE